MSGLEVGGQEDRLPTGLEQEQRNKQEQEQEQRNKQEQEQEQRNKQEQEQKQGQRQEFGKPMSLKVKISPSSSQEELVEMPGEGKIDPDRDR